MKISSRNLSGVMRLSLFVATGFIFLFLEISLSAAQETAPDAFKAGEKIYMEACVNCHGPDGKGMPQSLVGFDLPLPDFTDCDFTVREPDADWWSIVHQGGPVKGFSKLMPAFGEALKGKEIEQAIVYIRTFCTDRNWPRGELNLPRPLITEKAFPEDEAVFNIFVSENTDFIGAEFVYEQRFGARNQLEFAFPFGWSKIPESPGANPATNWTSNLGDVALAVKRALYHSLEHGSIFSATAEVVLPTGDEANGFGKGTFVFEPFISYGQILRSDFFLHAQTGLELPFSKDKAESEIFFRAALGRSFISGRWGRTWSPMVELLLSRELASGATISWDVVPQVQVTLNKRQHIMLNFGVRLPVNKTAERDWQVMLYLLWDWFDGGFFEGW